MKYVQIPYFWLQQNSRVIKYIQFIQSYKFCNSQDEPIQAIVLFLKFPLNRVSIIHLCCLHLQLVVQWCSWMIVKDMKWFTKPYYSCLVHYNRCLMSIKAPLVSKPAALISSFTRGAIVKCGTCKPTKPFPLIFICLLLHKGLLVKFKDMLIAAVSQRAKRTLSCKCSPVWTQWPRAETKSPGGKMLTVATYLTCLLCYLFSQFEVSHSKPSHSAYHFISVSLCWVVTK